MTLFAVQLESFLAVAAHSSVSRAAEHLHLSQPAVTKQLRALERALGVKLVVRTPHGIRLTDAGELLRDYARRSAALLDECRSALDDLADGSAGKLVIGAGVTTSMFQLPGWLRSYRQQWPRVDIRVRTGSSREIAELVRAREVDCGFVTSEIKHTDLAAERLYEERILLVVSASPATETQPRKRTHVRLEQIPLIVFPQHTGFRRFLDRAFTAAGLEPCVKMEIDSVEATKSLVAVGLGGAFLPEPAVRRELDQKQLRRLSVDGLPTLRRHTSLLRRADRVPGRALSNFLGVLRSLTKRAGSPT